jgi:hypothetical protein
VRLKFLQPQSRVKFYMDILDINMSCGCEFVISGSVSYGCKLSYVL